MHQQSRLFNKYVQIETRHDILFSERVEVEVQKNRCKVFDLIPNRTEILTCSAETKTTVQSLTNWNLQEAMILELLKSNKCLAIVDGSFFPEHPAFISAHWKFVFDKKIIGTGGFVAKVQPHLQSAYAAEVCGGLGIMSSIQHLLDEFHYMEKIDISIGTDCQSAIHKFSSDQKVVSFDMSLSYEIREFLRLKRKYLRSLTTFKIAGHQDRVKQRIELNFDELINIMCDHKAKQLITQQLRLNNSPSFPFHFQSPKLFNRNKDYLSSTDLMRDEVHLQIATPYLTKKLNIASINQVDYSFRKQIIMTLPTSMHVWLSKSFTKFAGTAHQLRRQGLVETNLCRMCSSVPEEDTLHVLLCTHIPFKDYRTEVISRLQVKILPLLEEDMLPLCLLEWLLDDECVEIDGLSTEVMEALTTVGKRGVWFGFLPTLFLKWVK